MNGSRGNEGRASSREDGTGKGSPFVNSRLVSGIRGSRRVDARSPCLHSTSLLHVLSIALIAFEVSSTGPTPSISALTPAILSLVKFTLLLNGCSMLKECSWYGDDVGLPTRVGTVRGERTLVYNGVVVEGENAECIVVAGRDAVLLVPRALVCMPRTFTRVLRDLVVAVRDTRASAAVCVYMSNLLTRLSPSATALSVVFNRPVAVRVVELGVDRDLASKVE